MKSKTELEPGVLQTFRLFIGVRLVIVLLAGLVELVLHVPAGRVPVRPAFSLLFIVSVLDAGLLFLYLSWSTLPRLLGAAYLPIGIAWAAIGPILLPYLTFFGGAQQVTDGAVMLGAWQLIPILFIPLVIISWQYSFRQVILFCVLTAFVELLPLMFLSYPLNSTAVVYPLLGVIMIRTVAFLFVGHMIINLTRVQRSQRHELTEANLRLARYANTLEYLTISRERNRMARELHDVLAHTLSEVAVELEAVRALWDVDAVKAQTMLAHSLEATREGLTETRRALQELRAAPLEDLGLGLAVRGLAETAASRAGLKVDLRIAENLGDYPTDVQQSIYRVAQEALSNIVEHAGARCVRVSLEQQDGQLKLLVADDGRGFDPLEPSSDQTYGLRGMRERAEMTGGQFHVESAPGQGARVTLIYNTARRGAGGS